MTTAHTRYPRDLLLCANCRDWRDVPAHPGPKPGSLVICDHGETTHNASWKPCWTARTAEQRIEDANAAGHLF